jgi:hypothetical protein
MTFLPLNARNAKDPEAALTMNGVDGQMMVDGSCDQVNG